MFRFYFRSLQWLCFHVCNPQIICLKNKNQKTQTPSTLNTLWLSSCVVFTHMWVIWGEVYSRTSSLLSTFLASGFSIACVCPPKAYLGLSLTDCFISHGPFALLCPSSGCDFDFHRLVQLVVQRCRICAWKHSLCLACIQKVDFWTWKHFLKRYI